MPRFVIFGAALVALLFGFLAYQMLTSLTVSGVPSIISTTHEWRQRMTVTVETPMGEVQGSAVTEVETRLMNEFFAGDIGGAKPSYWGEAVVVNIGEGQYLFALLGGTSSWILNELSAQGVDGQLPDLVSAFRQMEVPLVLSPRRYPRLVTFTDINDPASVIRVNPDDLAASFGEGVRLKEIALEFTTAPVTEGLVDGVLGADFFRRWVKIRRPLESEPGWLERHHGTPLFSFTRNDFIKGSTR